MMIEAPEQIGIDSASSLPPVRHLADAGRGFEYALCGTPRTRPLDPSLWFRDEEFCVVCLEMVGCL